ncbi:hypothetical protein BOX15_Mlig002353g1, partial [Macrostomum lignano]
MLTALLIAWPCRWPQLAIYVCRLPPKGLRLPVFPRSACPLPVRCTPAVNKIHSESLAAGSRQIRTDWRKFNCYN